MTIAANQIIETRDPIAYDIMREAANWLRGEYLVRERAARDVEERHAWRNARYRVDDEVRAIDPRDQNLVREKTSEFSQLREELAPLAKNEGPVG